MPIPVEQCDRKNITGLLSLSETEIDTVYSKLLLASPSEVMSIIQVERMELKSQHLENEGCPELCFIEQALEFLHEREALLMKSLGGTKTVDCATQIDSAATLATLVENELVSELDANLNCEGDISRVRYESVSSEGGTGSEDDHPNIAVEDLEITNHQTSKPFYFYQG